MLVHRSALLWTIFNVTMVIHGQDLPEQELDSMYWQRLAQSRINDRLLVSDSRNRAKNVILFIGDGMGVSTVTASRILRGQLDGKPGEETVLAFEEFPHVALSRTYNVDYQTPDSAGTVTAILSGVKTRRAMIGLTPRAKFGNCASQSGNEVESIMDWANKAGKRTGIVVTSRITHATPAGAYAHIADRDWEGDVDMEDVEGGCKDIAYQLIHHNPHINVVLGGGRRYFLPNTLIDPETNKTDQHQRNDHRHLIQDWMFEKQGRNVSHQFVWNKEQFDHVNPTQTDFILGLFEPSHMQYELNRDDGPLGEPSIKDMTRKAIEVLQRGEKGFFLLVEGSRIDHGHHGNKAKKALYETLAMEDAVKEALRITDEKDTLIVVTADHSHVFNIAGYPKRGADIFGLVEPAVTSDEKPHTILEYSNGPGYKVTRANLSGVDIAGDNDFVYPSGIPISSETHAGEDVPIFAKGPMAHLFYGVQEQSYIAHVMAYSACIGPYETPCNHGDGHVTELSPNQGVAPTPIHTMLFVACAVATSSLLITIL